MTWNERIATISIYPDMASKEDVARLASNLMECRHELQRLSEIVGDQDEEIINSILEQND